MGASEQAKTTAPQAGPPEAGEAPFDIGRRVASAVLLAALSLWSLWAGVQTVALLLAVFATIVAWEWGRLVRGSERDIYLLAHGFAVVGATGLGAFGLGALGLILLLVVAPVLVVLRLGKGGWLTGLGVLYVGLPALALVWFRADPLLGVLAVLFVFVVVWSTDTFAFLAGRLIGGPKLWPAVSPGKTWAGAVGGAVAVVIVSAFHEGIEFHFAQVNVWFWFNRVGLLRNDLAAHHIPVSKVAGIRITKLGENASLQLIVFAVDRLARLSKFLASQSSSASLFG